MSKDACPAVAGRNQGALAAAALLAATAGFVPSDANATNGFFANGYGAASKAQAGAGITHGEGPLAPAQNPALGVDIGNVAGLCFTGFMPHRDVEVGAGGAMPAGEYESKNEFFPIVCGGANYMVNDKTSLGVVAFGNGGMNTEYEQNPFAGFGAGSSPLGVDMAQLFIAFNGAYKVTDNFRVGAAPVLAIQRFKARGLQAFDNQVVSTSPGHVTNRDYDYSYGGGGKLGVNFDVTDWLTLGATYQSRMYMTKFDKYSGLFAEQGDFDIPAYVGEGIGIKPAKDWTVQLEHQRIFYNSVKALGNSGVAPSNALQLGADNGAGFGWEDMDIFRIGIENKTTDRLTLRGGFSYATDFIENKEVLFNVLSPATIKYHLGAGFTYLLTDKWAITGSYLHGFSESVTGRNQFFTPNQDTKLRMDQDELSVGFSYRF